MKKLANFLIISLWVLMGLYFGVGGYMAILSEETRLELSTMKIQEGDSFRVDEKKFSNFEEYKWIKNKELLEKMFPWLLPIPQSLAVIIAALSFGILGGITRLVKQLAFEDAIDMTNVQSLNIPLLGMLSGIIMLGLTFVVPTLLTTGEQELRPTTLVFLTLFAGLFAKRFYDWLNSSFNIIFPPQTESK